MDEKKSMEKTGKSYKEKKKETSVKKTVFLIEQQNSDSQYSWPFIKQTN